MTSPIKRLAIPCLALAIVACAHAPSEVPDDRPLALAQGSCGGCHAVERHGLSPNPDAPPFAAIANTEGLTRESLTAWLRDAHNYPEEMDFYLYDQEVGALVEHILTLRDPDYRPSI